MDERSCSLMVANNSQDAEERDKVALISGACSRAVREGLEKPEGGILCFTMSLC